MHGSAQPAALDIPDPLDLPVIRSREDLRGWLTTLIAAYLDVSPDELDPQRPLAEAGLDSVYALSVCGDIEEMLRVPVEPTLAWDHPTLDAMVDYLHDALSKR